MGLKSDGTVVAKGENFKGQCDVDSWSEIIAISASVHYTVGLREDGTVVACGDNNWGQCDVENWTDIIAISAGRHHVVGLKADGSVVATGYNVHGECEVSYWADIQTNATCTVPNDGLSSNEPDQEFEGSTPQEPINNEQETESNNQVAEEPNDENTSDNNLIDPDFKTAMDSYEAVMDEYVAFMQKFNANPNDVTLLANYASYAQKYAEAAQAFAKWEDDDLNDAEMAYYQCLYQICPGGALQADASQYRASCLTNRRYAPLCFLESFFGCFPGSCRKDTAAVPHGESKSLRK